MMMKSLPSSYALQCVGDCWFSVARIHRPHDRINFDRQRLQLDGRGDLVVVEASEAPIAPALPSRRRLDSARRRG
jgi:hypothetical protein